MTYESEKLSKEIAKYIHTVTGLLARDTSIETAVERIFDGHLAFVIEKYFDGQIAEETAEILNPNKSIIEMAPD